MMRKYLTIDFLINLLLIYFSNIKSREILNEWEDNNQIINSSSEETPISLAFNYDIQSPLFSINNIYYFCSPLSLFKIENNKVEEIKIEIKADIEYKDYTSIKCYYYQKMESIVVGLIGTYNILYYRLKYKDWASTFLRIASHLVEMNSCCDDQNIEYFAAISRENNNFYSLNVAKYNNGTFQSYDSGINKFEYKENQNIVIGFRDKETIIIFTYIQGQSFNIYHYNSKEMSMKLLGQNYLSYFKEYSFTKVKFIDNTPIIYYLITRNGRYYIGAADLKYFIILYNIEVFNNVEIRYDEGYYSQSKGFLFYKENNVTKKVCPFVLNGDSCLYYSSGKYFTIKKSTIDDYYYMNFWSDTCSNGLKLGNYCLENCPINSIPDSSTNKCIQCEYDKFYNYEKKLCSGSCTYNLTSKICYDCEKDVQGNKIFYEDTCINYGDCSEFYKIFNENTKTCEKCEKKFYDLATNKCTNECPKYSEIMRINDTDICINCPFFNKHTLISNDLYYCYHKCPPYHISKIEKNTNIKICERCPNNQIYKNGECVDKCDSEKSEATITINGTEIKYCLSCKELNKKLKNGICVENCGEQYEENEICVESCSPGYGKNDHDKKCEKCIDKGKFLEDGVCKDKCDEKKGWNETDNICVDCFKYNLFLEDNRCVSNCKEGSRINPDEKICGTCPTEKPYLSGGNCYEKCPEFSQLNINTKSCSFCSDDTYFFNNKCLDFCQEPYVPEVKDGKNTCVECEKGTFYVAGKCESSCQDGSFLTYDDKSCHICYCNNNGKCYNTSSNECICFTREREKNYINYRDNYFGHSCEFSRTFKDDEEEDERFLRIQPFYNTSINSNVSFFTFSFEKPDKNKDYKYTKIEWKFYRLKEELTSKPKYKKYFVTGTSEEIFGINPNLFDLEKPNH